MSKAESDHASGVLSGDHVGVPALEDNGFTYGDALKDSQSDQSSGWFEVKKKNRSSGKANKHKSTTSIKTVGPYRRAKAYSVQTGREESKVDLSSVEQKGSTADWNEQFSIKSKDLDSYDGSEVYSGQNGIEGSKVNLSSIELKESSADLNEQFLIKSKGLNCFHGASNGVSSQLRLVDNMERSNASFSADKVIGLAKDPRELTAHHQLAALLDTPKFKWGNLDDEDLTQSNMVDIQIENNMRSLQVSHQEVAIEKVEDSTICLEGGKQSSTKELNGLKNEASGNSLAVYSHTQDVDAVCDTPERESASHTSGFIPSIEFGNHMKDAIDKGLAKDSAISKVEDLIPPSAPSVDEKHSSTDGDETTAKLYADQPILSEIGMGAMGANYVSSESAQEVTSHMISERTGVLDSPDSTAVTGLNGHQQVAQDVLGSEGTGGGRMASKQPMEFSVAASMLMGKFEETKSGESKERFRQRLWCYLFENLNRAIDELYFLCELECDMEQIQEALLVLKEAGMDFSELKSRVEGFEKVKKNPCTPQGLFGGNAGGSFPAKVEHRRPHAIAWEVRRMACSPHRAEILSSSLEAFKKVQQITAQKNLVSQSKRREASKLLDIEQTCTGLPGKQIPSMNSSTYSKEAASKAEQKKPFVKVNNKSRVSNAQNGDETHVEIVKGNKEMQGADSTAASASSKVLVAGKACNTVAMDRTSYNTEVTDDVTPEDLGFADLKADIGPVITPTAERTNKSTEKHVSIVDNQREKKTPKTRGSMDAWKVKRNWEDVLSSPLKSLNRASRSPCPGWKSTERVKVLHDKLMSPERKRKSPLEMKKEVDEKQARATRIRRELENERVQRLQKTTEKLNRVSEWKAVRSTKLREGMHARQQRGESRHEAHLAEIARRAGDESSKVSEVRFITSLNEENKKLSLRQKLQDSELRRAERLQIIKIKQKEDVAREEAVLERRRIIEAERLQRLAEAQRKKEEAKARRDEERKAASAAREARAVEQVRKKEVRAKAQQEVTELQAQKLTEKLRESELRRKCYLEQIRERAAMESREQASPSTRLSLSKDGQPKISGNQAVTETDASIEKETVITRQCYGSKGATGLISGVSTLKEAKSVLQRQSLKKRVKKIRQRLMAKKYDFVEPPTGAEGFGVGSMAIAAAARSKIGRWLQDLQRFQLARKAGTSGVSFIVAEMIKYFDGKAAELHAARQAGLVDFIATALPASHTSKGEASQTTLSLLRILKVLLDLPANRSYFISRNLLPPLIPILSTALENFSSQDSVSIAASNANAGSLSGVSDKLLNDEKLDAVGEVLNGLLECVILVINHSGTDERQFSMQDDLVELLTACEVIRHLRDLFSLFDRPQAEGAPFPAPVLFGLNLLQALTGSRRKPVGLTYDAQLSTMLERRETEKNSLAINEKAMGCAVNLASFSESTETPSKTRGENPKEDEHQTDKPSQAVDEGQDEPGVELVENSSDNSEPSPGKPVVEELVIDNAQSEPINTEDSNSKREASERGDALKKDKVATEQTNAAIQGSSSVSVEEKHMELLNEKGQTLQSLLPVCHSINFLVSAIAETGLVGLPSLLTAVLLQTNPRSTPEQAAAVLPSNFEEVATCVLKVLNNLARLDLGLVQSLLAMPDLQMEFFHLVSFLLSHCTCKWNNSTDQVASLLLETLLLLGYFALLHPGNQAVLRWGKSPTILHKICDLPFAFFSDPLLMPALVGTLLAVCYGSEQNRDVVREELSMDMLLSLLKSSRSETLADKDTFAETTQTSSNEHISITNQKISMDRKADSSAAFDDESIPAKEEIKRMIEDTHGSDCETSSNTRQQVVLRSSCGKFLNADALSPNKRFSKPGSKSAATSEGELSLSKDSAGGRVAISRNLARGNALSTSTENASSQLRKNRVNGSDSSAKNGNSNAGPIFNKRQLVAGPLEYQQTLGDRVPISADSCEPNMCLRAELMLQNRFPARLLDMAQDFFAAGL